VGGLVSAAYLLIALRRLYGQDWGRTLLHAVPLYFVMMLIELGLALAAGEWVGRSG
jgi:hypothetical protein